MMFEGLPDETTFDEAVNIKAAQGDQWAIGYIALKNTGPAHLLRAG